MGILVISSYVVDKLIMDKVSFRFTKFILEINIQLMSYSTVAHPTALGQYRKVNIRRSISIPSSISLMPCVVLDVKGHQRHEQMKYKSVF